MRKTETKHCHFGNKENLVLPFWQRRIMIYLDKDNKIQQMGIGDYILPQETQDTYEKFKQTKKVKTEIYQVLKANMKIVGATEYAVVLYRDKLPKFRNIDEDGKKHMIFNWFEWKRDGKEIPKIHPTQKPVGVLKKLIEIFTDEGDVVIDPVAGSGSTLRACMELKRNSYGFEIEKDFYNKAKEQMIIEKVVQPQTNLEIEFTKGDVACQ